jgi:hypothetical protein
VVSDFQSSSDQELQDLEVPISSFVALQSIFRELKGIERGESQEETEESAPWPEDLQ